MSVKNEIIKEILQVRDAFKEEGVTENVEPLILSYFLRLVLTHPCFEWEELKKFVDKEESWAEGLLYKEYVGYCVKIREEMLRLAEGKPSQKL
jgi:hypothetical protein